MAKPPVKIKSCYIHRKQDLLVCLKYISLPDNSAIFGLWNLFWMVSGSWGELALMDILAFSCVRLLRGGQTA